MRITVAKTSGFCFGVQRAVDLTFQQVNSGKKVCTYGELIHNPQIVKQLKDQGVDIIYNVEENTDGRAVIIRSHGVSKSVYQAFLDRGWEVIDTTCPFVSRIHKIVSEIPPNGILLIAGDAKHPEMQGIMGYFDGQIYTFSCSEELDQILEEISKIAENEFVLVSQTTFSTVEWQKCVEKLKKVCTKVKIFDTICNATEKRQSEACLLAKQNDAMVVVGGKNSSNTAKLAQICREYCDTFLIESAQELHDLDMSGYNKIGVTAGASTPAGIIKEVHKTMSEILKDQDELSFEEMLEQSLKTINNREKVTAVVTGIHPNEISVDIGTKHAGYVPLGELTDDPNAKTEDLAKVGDEMELMVVRVNDVEGTVMLSKKRLDAIAGFEKVMDAADTEEILEGIVVEVIKGGVLALTNGVRVFIPASQATVSRSDSLEDLLKQKVQFKILEVNRQRKRAVGSIRAVLREQRKVLEEAFWKEAEIGKHYTGTVKSLTNYGAFVNLGGVDGMVHISELSWSRIKHPSEVVSVGDTLDVYIRDIDSENKKISLGYKKTEDNPWEVVKTKFQVGDTCKVKIVSLTPFGAFAQLIPGIDGLIHISQIANERINKPADVLSVGQEVDVKITELDTEKKRVSLSIRALLDPPQAPAEEAPAAEESAVVYEAGPQDAAPAVEMSATAEGQTALEETAE